jgi:signal transduction histidine kinase
MAHGTSAHGESLSRRWTDAKRERAGFRGRIDWRQVAGEAAPLQLLALSAIAGLALGLMLTNASDTALHAAVLAAVGALALSVALRPRQPAEPARRDDCRAPDEPSQLLAQMHHELRTPLNAMIGFSEVMLRELHGPLGNARYQEYAAHISESGGRLLKASEDALAVAASMSALVADRRVLRRERLPTAALVREAWAAVDARGPRLELEAVNCAAVEIACDRQATGQALQQLLSEAAAQAGPGGTVVARERCTGDSRCLELTVAPPAGSEHLRNASQLGAGAGGSPGNGLLLILTRSLLEMQGATLSLDAQPRSGRWTARIAFPALPAGQLRGRLPRVSAAARWPASPARRGGFAISGAAARASAESPAAPPA